MDNFWITAAPAGEMGPFDVTGFSMTWRLIRVAVGVEGMPLYRGAIG